MAISRLGKKRRGEYGHGLGVWWRNGFNIRNFFLSRKRLYRLLICLAAMALLPPIFLHFRLKRFQQIQLKRCAWVRSPPLICAHGGDTTKSFPNTISAYQHAIRFNIDCIEVDVSRSEDGILFALHDRDLQRITGNNTSKVGHMSWKEIKDLDVVKQFSWDFHNQKIPTLEESLKLISNSVQQVILDAKVGPPFYEKGLAKDIISVIRRTHCTNCLVWSKSDELVRDVIKLSPDVTAGYILMREALTRSGSRLLRIKDARVVGVYHQLIDEKLMRILHGSKKKVYAWTVDDTKLMEKMVVEHVDGIVTGSPTSLQRLMQDLQTQCLLNGFSF